MSSPGNTSAWIALQEHSKQFQQADFRLSDLFTTSANRFTAFSLRHENLLLDFSKNYLTPETLRLLLDLADQQQLSSAIKAMYDGELINTTEQRAALHVALRQPAASSDHPEVEDTLAKMEDFVAKVHSGRWTGYSNKRITDIVNIGIGGSDLGPAMVTDALAAFAVPEVNLHFVSNVDPSQLDNTLAKLDPETTLFIVASKSFKTLETHQNAASARTWLMHKANDESATGKHFVAITSNLEAATKFGIDKNNLFPLWDWVGGRFSLWSAIGLPIALAVGMENFRQLLAGAHSMDQHFREAELAENMPVIMALLSVWYTGSFDSHSTAVVPYSQSLNLLPSFLQQLHMESLGKSSDLQGKPISTNTGEVLWGTAGSNGQHSYFQLLHQGTQFIPVDFIAAATCQSKIKTEQQQHLLANCFSQSLALMEGKTEDSTEENSVEKDSVEANSTNAHKTIAGNKPSNTLLISELNPYNLGCLIALYEHKVYVQSVLWNINAFDQWGVELGKKLAEQIFAAMSEPGSTTDLDDSTLNLIKQARDWR